MKLINIAKMAQTKPVHCIPEAQDFLFSNPLFPMLLNLGYMALPTLRISVGRATDEA